MAALVESDGTDFYWDKFLGRFYFMLRRLPKDYVWAMSDEQLWCPTPREDVARVIHFGVSSGGPSVAIVSGRYMLGLGSLGKGK